MIIRTVTAAVLVVAWTAAAAVFLVAGAGCAHAPRGQPLMEAVRAYNDGVRWERFAVAASAVPARERDAFLDEREILAEDLNITDYEVVRVSDRGVDAAEVQVKVTWYRDSEGTVHETWARQAWERRGKAWRIVGERRVRGHEMPGLPAGENDATAGNP
jgi:hypothetical protein